MITDKEYRELSDQLKAWPCCEGRAQFSYCVDYALVFCQVCGLSTRRCYQSDEKAKLEEAFLLWQARVGSRASPVKFIKDIVLAQDPSYTLQYRQPPGRSSRLRETEST